MSVVKAHRMSGRLERGVLALLLSTAFAAHAAVPGISGPSFTLQAAAGYTAQPDGTSIYTWGYGCDGAPGGGFLPAGVPNAQCGAMQLPGPTLIVNQGDVVSVTLTNNMPAAAGSTSMLFPGFTVSAAAAAVQPAGCTGTATSTGVLTTEANHGCAVTYTFEAGTPGTHAYYSGTQGDLQVEMGLYGAVIVLPNLSGVPAGYANYKAALPANLPDTCRALNTARPGGGSDQRLAAAAYDHPSACYDREYLFQLSEMDLEIHREAEKQKDLPCGEVTGCMEVTTEPYHPSYFLVNGRSFPDVAEPNYAVNYRTQPYNGNPHAHPGELVLVRVIGTGRWQHPLHEHGNHLRILAVDGNLITSASGKLAGPLVFTTTSTPGMTMDGIYQWTAKGLNWDVYAHADGITSDACVPDANGYYTTGSGAPLNAPNYYEWCDDHEKALETRPFGQVGSGGPMTLPDPTIVAMGAYYGGSPYFGSDATARAVGSTPVPPSGTVGNTTGSYAFMWHSHNEREITTNNAFPGGLMMMLLVDPWDTTINEAN
ncbi:MAG: multicopper oxidase family protein [Gammaproteobacteria bacterium]|nr:multicopper oxidase family protein [Gammaproteobacteria bacterium]